MTQRDDIRKLVDRLMSEADPAAQATHSQCKFYAAIEGKDNVGKCGKFSKEVPAKGPVCGEFETRGAEGKTTESPDKALGVWVVRLSQMVVVGGRKEPEPVDRYFTVRARTARQATKAVRDAGHSGELVSVNQVAPSEAITERRRIRFRSPEAMQEWIDEKFGHDELLLATATTFADAIDPKMGGGLASRDWDGEAVDAAHFLEQAETFERLGGFSSDTAIDLADAFGPDARFRLYRRGGVRVIVYLAGGFKWREGLEPPAFGTSTVEKDEQTVTLGWDE